MKKRLYIILVIIFVIAGYAFGSYRYFYYRLHSGHLIWPDNQNTYYLANNATQSTIKNKIYIALGDSLTSGVGVNNYQQSYPYLVAKGLAGSGQPITLINYSYPGYKTADLIKNSLDQTISGKPDIVTVLIGINDAHGSVSTNSFKENYELILNRLSQETTAKIYLINIPFLGANDTLLPPYNFYFNQKTRSFNKVIKDLSVKYNISYIDLYSSTNSVFNKDDSNYSRDGYHPSVLGYQTWAKIISYDISK